MSDDFIYFVPQDPCLRLETQRLQDSADWFLTLGTQYSETGIPADRGRSFTTAAKTSSV